MEESKLAAEETATQPDRQDQYFGAFRISGPGLDFPEYPGTQGYRDWIAIAFARRVALGEAREFECRFMESFMDADLAERNLLGDCVTAKNLTELCNAVESRDCSGIDGFLMKSHASVHDGAVLGGE